MTPSIVRAIIHSMIGGDVNPYPILILINYWETGASSVAARLDELLKRGITQAATFVPWQVAESDISHALIRFLQAAAERQMQVILFLSPELGIHCPNSGLPKDLIHKKENWAYHSQAEPIGVHLPPNSFALPSFFSDEFNKRYYSYLARMDSFFHDLSKNQPSLMQRLTIGLTGSFWKYYRSTLSSTHQPFAGSSGDYSTHSALAFRQRMEQYFSQREFCDPTPASANRWKTRAMEDTNHKWFYQHAEDIFRARSCRAIKRKSTSLRLAEFEIYTPEADPSLSYNRFFQMISGCKTDFAKISRIIDESSWRNSCVEGQPTAPFIHWSAMGGFRSLSDSEKQFLILKTLLLLSTRGGGILIEDADWRSLSYSFRCRTEALVKSLTQDSDFKLRSSVLYLSPHLWSGCGTLWEELMLQLGSQVRMIVHPAMILREKYSHLLVVDPAVVMTKELVQKLISWANAGRVLALPRSTLYTESARKELAKALANKQKIEVNLGLPYSLHALGDGKLVLYDVPVSLSLKAESLSMWQDFVQTLLSLSETQTGCKSSDPRVQVISYETPQDGMASFVLNSSSQAVNSELTFPQEVRVSDLGAIFTQSGRKQSKAEESQPVISQKITLDVPAFGVLPIKIEGLDLSRNKERQIAAMNIEQTKHSAMVAAHSELPGLGQEGSIEDLWN